MKVHNIDIIKKHEGLRLEAYMPTPNDVWTIGYGHTHTTKQGMKITAGQAESLLRKDITWVEKAVNKLVVVPLTQNQFDALSSLVFNIGEGAFAASTLLRYLNKGRYQEAAAEFMRWIHAGGKRLDGLIRRRRAEQELFLRD